MHRSPLDFKVYGADGIDSETFEQMTTAMKIPVVVKGALMADAHVATDYPLEGGWLLPIMPWCLMEWVWTLAAGCAWVFIPILLWSLIKSWTVKKNIIIENTRFGLSEFNDIGNHELMERKEFKEIDFLKSLQKLFYNQLGTSGHGNHFVNMGVLSCRWKLGWTWASGRRIFCCLSHSGSRNFGARIANHYTDIARKNLG